MAAASKSYLSSSEDDDIIIVGSSCPKTQGCKSGLSSLELKKSMSKRPTWVNPSFDLFDDFAGTKKTKQAKLTKKGFSSKSSLDENVSNPKATTQEQDFNSRSWSGKSTKRKAVKNTDNLWSDKYFPTSKADLAVHNKKVCEVEQWFKTYQRNAGRLSPLLLVTGPAGCGKTATVKVLCKEMGLEVQEWTNPVTTGTESRDREGWSVDGYSQRHFPESESQLKIFQDFLLRANKYQMLQIFGGTASVGKVILVEDFPNMFYQNPQSFHDVLRKYKQQGKCPIVFIVSDSASGQSNERLLFPPDIQAELNVSSISFNPVALTLLTKLLTRIASSEASCPANVKTFSKPTAGGIESIAMSCAGDIRGAVNSLQFASLKGQGDIVKSRQTVPKGSSRKGKSKSAGRSTEADQNALGSRDSSMFLFRALGKILYAKRDSEESNSIALALPPHLKHFERSPLQVNTEDVIDKCHISSDFFNAYLHQNYLEFFSKVEDTDRASEYFSDTDFITSNSFNRRVLEPYSSCVAARGLMHSNSSGSSGGSSRGWKPLHKPQLYGSIRKARSTMEAGKSMFRTYKWTPEVLFTELLPYISLINITLHNPKQISFLQEVCRFAGHSGPDTLNDKEGMEIQDIDDMDAKKKSSKMPPVDYQNEESNDGVSLSQTNVKVPVEEEECIIEDFDFD